MKQQILHISVLQTAKVLAALYFIISLPIVLIMFIPMMGMPSAKPPFLIWFLFAMPFLYAIFGFIFSVIGAWAYNLIARSMGGIEFTVQTMSEL